MEKLNKLPIWVMLLNAGYDLFFYIYKFNIKDMTDPKILSREKTILLTKDRLAFELSLINTPTPPPEL